MKSILWNKFFLLGFTWAVFNVYFLPFAIWTVGIVRPWFIINGLLPYKDFNWIRTPFDIFVLSFWYRIFGVKELSYQLFVFSLLVTSLILVFYISRNLLRQKYTPVFLFYLIFLFPLFINTEEGELLIGVFLLMIFINMYKYFQSSKIFWLFLAGIIGGLVFITKQNASLVLVASLCSIGFNSYIRRNSWIRLIKDLFIFLIGVIVPVFVMVMYFYLKGDLYDYLYYTIFFIFGSYAKQQPNLIHGDGLWIAGGFLTLLFPFILFWKKTHLQPQIVVLISLMTVFALLSLLPSFLSYRASPAFGLVSIVAGLNIALLTDKTVRKITKVIVIASFLIFLTFIFRFINSYISFIQENPISFGQYITDYGENEKKISIWVKTNTRRDERITNFGNEIIYLWSKRLPKHKYLDPFPYLLQPYEITSRLYINDPPSVVIYDKSLPEIHRGLEKWPFIPFMEKTYKKVGQYDETLVIYQLGQ